MQRDREICSQRIWYCANLLCGRIDDAAFAAQPQRMDAGYMAEMVHAWKAEIAHQPAAALAAYRRCQGMRHYAAIVFESWILERIAALSRNAEAAPSAR